MTTEYFITQSGSTYTIAKFQDSSEPSAIYIVKGKSCDCPGGSRRGTCKHINMVAKWSIGHYYLNDVLLPIEGFDQAELKL